MNISLLALISDLARLSKEIRKLIYAYDIQEWKESKQILESLQDLAEKLDTAKE